MEGRSATGPTTAPGRRLEQMGRRLARVRQSTSRADQEGEGDQVKRRTFIQGIGAALVALNLALMPELTAAPPRLALTNSDPDLELIRKELHAVLQDAERKRFLDPGAGHKIWFEKDEDRGLVVCYSARVIMTPLKMWGTK